MIRKLLVLVAAMLVAIIAVLVVWRVSQRVRELEAPVDPVTFQELEATFRGSRDLTEAQRQELLASLSGTKVRWSGVVEDVDQDNVVFVDIDGLLYDVRFQLTREQAVRVNRGETITFVGLIDRVESFLWSCRVVLRDVRLEKEEVQ